MLRRISWHVLPFLFLITSSVFGAEDWAKLKFGMTADETVEALGHPVFKNVGNGFELWIYDNNAEVVFYGGPLIGWTTPSKDRVPGKAVDVWQRLAAGSPTNTVFVLPRSPRVKRSAQSRDDGADRADRLPYYRLR